MVASISQADLTEEGRHPYLGVAPLTDMIKLIYRHNQIHSARCAQVAMIVGLEMRTIWLLIRLSRPLFLLGGVLVYALGVGIARYLGMGIDWGMYFVGQFWVTTLQLAGQYLNEYFDCVRKTTKTTIALRSPGEAALWVRMDCPAGLH